MKKYDRGLSILYHLEHLHVIIELNQLFTTHVSILPSCLPRIKMFTRAGVKRALSRTTRRRPLIVVDFDETITTKDTISLLAQFAYAKNSQAHVPPWSHFTTAYLNDYQRYKEQCNDNVTTIEQKTKQLSSLKPVELASLERVSNAGVFARLTRDEIRMGAMELVPVRDHVQQTLQSNIDNLFIVSVNWSKDWILGALSSLSLSPSAVLSNDLVFDNDISTGRIIPSVVTADDKLKKFQDLQNSDAWSSSLYIGDSETDLPCLGLLFYFFMYMSLCMG